MLTLLTAVVNSWPESLITLCSSQHAITRLEIRTWGLDSEAGLTALNVTASANDWDTRTEWEGCAPNSCIASNAVDGSVEDDSRWSCHSTEDDGDACELALDLGGPHDVEEIRLALWEGDTRTRLINVLADGQYLTTIESSGTTESYEPYRVAATGISTIVLQSEGTNDESYNGWLSILEVEVMVGAVVDESSAAPAPTDPDYVGCFDDMLDDRVMSIVLTMDDLTSEVCSAACGEIYFLYYALQQGNECWCSRCDLTDGELSTDYDRHGEGSCTTPCAGDPSSTCGGDMAFDLYLTGNCGPTPAPTVGGFESDCPAGSTPYALQVTFTHGAGSDLWVSFGLEEPGGEFPKSYSGLGDVGVISKSEDETVYMYTSLNGLSIDTDSVLGDYTIDIRGEDPGVPYAMTVMVAGEMVLDIINKTIPSVTHEYVVTVTEYAESDCNVEDMACVEDTFSSDGTPPCTACSGGMTSEEGSTTCEVAVFENVEISDDVAAAILADAVGGFIGGVFLRQVSDGDRTIARAKLDGDLFLVTDEDEATLQLNGTFISSTVVPESTALMVYIDSEEAEDLIVTQADLEFSTSDNSGTFTVTVEDLPAGSSNVYFSWSVLDPDYTPQYFGCCPITTTTVVHDACPSPLVITLEWDISSNYISDDSWQNYPFELKIKEPDGNVVNVAEAGSFGYLSSPAFGLAAMGYTVYGGNADAIGEYTARVYPWEFQDLAWTLTAEVDGSIAWVEEGMWNGSEFNSLSYTGWDESPSPFGDFTVDLNSTTAC